MNDETWYLLKKTAHRHIDSKTLDKNDAAGEYTKVHYCINTEYTRDPEYCRCGASNETSTGEEPDISIIITRQGEKYLFLDNIEVTDDELSAILSIIRNRQNRF